MEFVITCKQRVKTAECSITINVLNSQVAILNCQVNVAVSDVKFLLGRELVVNQLVLYEGVFLHSSIAVERMKQGNTCRNS